MRPASGRLAHLVSRYLARERHIPRAPLHFRLSCPRRARMLCPTSRETFITLSSALSPALSADLSAALSPPLAPTLGAPRALSDVYGPGVAVCARPVLEALEPVGRHRQTRDVLSARPIAIAAETPVICSAGGTDPTLLAVLRDGGLPVGTDLREFRSEAEFPVRVREAIGDGLRISMEYPQPTALCPDDDAVKTARLVGYLNNKASIGLL